MGTISERSRQKGLLPKCKSYNSKAEVKPFKNRTKTYYRVHVGWDHDDKAVRFSTANEEEAKAIRNKALTAAECEDWGDQQTVAGVAASHEIRSAVVTLKKYGATIPEAVEWFTSWHDQIEEWLTLQESWERWLDYRKPHNENTGKTGGREACSQSYYDSMKTTYLGPFVKIFGERKLVELTQKDFETWLFEHKKNVKPSQKIYHKMRLTAFLNWCAEKRFYSEHLQPLKKIKFGKDAIIEEDDFSRILRPEVVRSLLDYALESKKKIDWMTGIWMTIRLFCGIRSYEALRIKWGMVQHDGSVRFPAQRAKKGKSRYIVIPENAIPWLEEFFAKFSGEVKADKNAFIIQDVKAGGILSTGGQNQRWSDFKSEWITWCNENNREQQEILQNAMRDSFGSYGLIAIGQQETFRAMGEKDFNTFYNNYYNAATEYDAKSYFKLKPNQKPVEPRQMELPKNGKYFIEEDSKHEDKETVTKQIADEEPLEMTITMDRSALLELFPDLPDDFTGAYRPVGGATTYLVW